MHFSSCRMRVRYALLLVGVLLSGVSVSRVSAEDGPLEALFQAQLSAGEFGPAKRLAEQSGAARDRMLRQVAIAQSQAGVRGAAFSTAAGIGRDSDRASAFGALSSQPVFGGARGGASLADFDSLIQLIQSTIAPDTWADAGGVGAVEAFPGGCYVDTAGALKRLGGIPGIKTSGASLTGASRAGAVIDETSASLARLRRAAVVPGGNRDVREASVLRKISLTRLERQVQRLMAEGRRPDEAMRVLAGLTRIQYLIIYPETRDIVMAGPAGDWAVDGEGRSVNVANGQPTLLLDDLVAVLRNAWVSEGRFGCSITPRRENLESVQAFLSETSAKPLRPGGRDAWLAELHKRLGDQDITVHGLDPRTHAARVLVEADYRMKLVGMGLEPGVMGVKSYLDLLEVAPGGPLPAMDVLRWWFTLNYDALKTTPTRDVFQWSGSGVRVLSENEFLTERGERVHTGDSRDHNQLFAQKFTEHYHELAAKYPIYAELRNVFDLALAAAIIRSEDLAGQCDWELTSFKEGGNYVIERGIAPKVVNSVINHRQIDRQRFVVGVSGGVLVDTQQLVRSVGVKADSYGLMSAERGVASPPKLPELGWWWD